MSDMMSGSFVNLVEVGSSNSDSLKLEYFRTRFSPCGKRAFRRSGDVPVENSKCTRTSSRNENNDEYRSPSLTGFPVSSPVFSDRKFTLLRAHADGPYASFDWTLYGRTEFTMSDRKNRTQKFRVENPASLPPFRDVFYRNI